MKMQAPFVIKICHNVGIGFSEKMRRNVPTHSELMEGRYCHAFAIKEDFHEPVLVLVQILAYMDVAIFYSAFGFALIRSHYGRLFISHATKSLATL